MGIVDQFARRQARKVESQGVIGDYDWDKYEQAQQPEQHPLPTGQTLSMEDIEEDLNDPWDMYYTYIETVAVPQIEKTKTVLKTLDQSIPGGMLPEPNDPVDLPKLYPETIKQLDTIQNFLIERSPSSPAETDQFFGRERERSQQQRDQQVLDQIDQEGYPPELEEAKQGPRTRKEISDFYTNQTKRTGPPSYADDAIDPTEYPSSKLGMSTAQLFANRQR